MRSLIFFSFLSNNEDDVRQVCEEIVVGASPFSTFGEFTKPNGSNDSWNLLDYTQMFDRIWSHPADRSAASLENSWGGKTQRSNRNGSAMEDKPSR